MDIGTTVGLFGMALTISLFALGWLMTRADRTLMKKTYNRVARGVDFVNEPRDKIGLRDSLSAKVFHRDGSIEDLGELKPAG